MTDPSNLDLSEMEIKQDLSEKVTFFATKPLKLTLAHLARARHTSMGNLIRSALIVGLEIIDPTFTDIYHRYLSQKVKEKNNGNTTP